MAAVFQFMALFVTEARTGRAAKNRSARDGLHQAPPAQVRKQKVTGGGNDDGEVNGMLFHLSLPA